MSQLLQLQHASNRYYTAPQVLLAEQLCKRTGMQKEVFGNSGTEANECAIKLARKWGIDRHGADCYHIITLENSFHGHTLGALAAAGQPALKADFGPVLPGFHHVPANDLAAMQAAFAQYPVAGVMLELVQSEDGMKALDADYVQALCALCREKDALLIVDEVQTGNGRTGALYAYELFGIAPDVVTTANGLAGGLPIGVTLIDARAAGTLTCGTHSSTFGGNPVCAAAARAVLSRIDGQPLHSSCTQYPDGGTCRGNCRGETGACSRIRAHAKGSGTRSFFVPLPRLARPGGILYNKRQTAWEKEKPQ